MVYSDKYKKALEYATNKHRQQFRIGGLPYITHPIEVAEILKNLGFGEEYQIAGLFHDLLEDTDATEEEILRLGGPDILEAVRLLTKKKGYIMSEYIDAIKKNDIAFKVKAADRLHNLRSATVSSEDFKRKYIIESVEWFMDFSPEIPKAVKELAETLETPIEGLIFE
ncbi:MAG: bifunctional (p)ppGpp synthetase/guanosine-3',5'-bis(diphosphate) 3'-pyrophosphohydrolase [Clostridia bacterium]|nr:bifunctional (p)ppGpp synthetase/guanosine-3',5'-bis(diphosphate) 3'-pyrophosphohydrolase [Clostridia bacterium]